MSGMNAQVVQLPTFRVVMIRHLGPYEGLSPEFDRIWKWATAHNVPVQKTIGIYWDNPDFTPAPQLRSAACLEVPHGYQLTSPDGLPLESSEVPGGPYATTRYVGPYEQMAPVWTSFTNHIERTLRRQIREDIPAFEVYVNDPSDTPPHQLITDLYMPVR